MHNFPSLTFSKRLIDWQRLHGRHTLPWQKTHDPYPIWLSEIMLQQTQVDTVIPYYLRFLNRFPDLPALAIAQAEDVLTLWSGLGYYARARNLHKAAQIVMREHNGHFPQCAETIATLPGVGRSTAAAIAIFAFGERAAILDGNVKRVLCRYFGVEGFPGEKRIENELWSLAASLLPDKEIAIYTQAQMDLGATVCTRGAPDCGACPLHTDCVARLQDRCPELPTARPRKRPPRRHVKMVVLVHRGQILLERRPPLGIWGGLLSLPEVPDAAELLRWAGEALHAKICHVEALAPLSHTFTHFILDIEPWLIQAESLNTLAAENQQVWLSPAEAIAAALPTPIRHILKALPAVTGGKLTSASPGEHDIFEL